MNEEFEVVPLDLGVKGELLFARRIDHLVGVLPTDFRMEFFDNDTGVNTQIIGESLVGEVRSSWLWDAMF